MKIRLVDASLQRTRDIIRAMKQECFPWEDDDWNEWHGDWWLAYDPMPVAFAGLQASVRIEGAGYLCLAGVLGHARGKGLQRKLIRVREREARNKGWTLLITDTRPTNAFSANNLIACGFRAFQPKVAWAPHKEWCYWRKFLGNPA
jgi:GNAT superfamily N-acetyltransferase